MYFHRTERPVGFSISHHADLIHLLFVCLFGNVWKCLKVGRAVIVLVLGDFIPSVLIWTPVRRNALIHCILSNCLLGGGEGRGGRGRESTFLDSGRLPGCSPYYSASMQWLSPCTPTLPCKNIFSSSAGKTSCPFTLDYRAHLLRRSVFLRLAAKRDEIFQT